MKRVIFILLALMLWVPCCFAERTADNDPRFEGQGYNTPENAVLAYIDAMNRGDVDSLVSTFAVESLVDNSDPEAVLERSRMFQYTMYHAIPASNQAVRSLLIYRRTAEITEGLYRQYLYYCIDDPVAPATLRDKAEQERFLSRFDSSPAADAVGRIAFVEWISPLAIDMFSTAKSFENVARTYDVYGADDVACLIAHITIDGEDAVQFMDCIRYGDRWYNMRSYSIPAIIMGLDAFSNGFYAPSLIRSENSGLNGADLASMMKGTPDTEAMVVQLANSASGLCGRRLPLVGVNDAPGEVSIAASAEEAVSDTDRRSLYAELHFMTYGACVTIWASPGLQSELPMESAREKRYFSWMSMLGSFTLSDDSISLKSQNGRLVLSLDELQLEFMK